MNVNGACNDLTIIGNANWTANRTVNVGGNLALNNGGSITGGSTGTFNIAGTVTVPAGATATLGRTTITVTGLTGISGTLIVNHATGTKTFTDVTINNGGAWSSTVAEAFTIRGSVTNHGTFLANTGVYTLTGAGKTLGGTRNLVFSSVSISGSYTNTDSLQISTNFAGAGTLTQGANAYLVMGDLSPANILTASASGNTVRYLVSGNMSTLDITYHNLIIEELGGVVNGAGTYNVNGDYTVVGGTASLTSVTIGGNITVNAGSVLNVGAGPTTVSGTTTLNGTLNITSLTGTKTFNDIAVSSTGTWNASVAEAITVNGSLSVSGTFTSNTGTYTLAGSGKTISGSLSITNTTVTGSYTNNGTFTATTSLIGSGTFSQGAAGTLNMGTSSANFSVLLFNASASGNTVNYNLAGVQNIRVPSDGAYHHLRLSGTGNKTLLGATDINGDLTISSALVANNFNITLGGNWVNTGSAFTPGTNTTTLDGTSQSVSRTGGETFNHLVLSGSGTKTLGSAVTTNGNLTINSTLDVSASNYAIDVNGNWANNGTFTQRTGSVMFTGSVAQTIGGTSVTNFYDITQSNAAGVSLAQDQNLIGALTISQGTFAAAGYDFTLRSDASGTARIATIPSGANYSGNIIMERYAGTGPTDWRFLSSAVSGATIADWADDFPTSGFIGSTDPSNPYVSIYSYDETQLGNLDTFGFVPVGNVTDPIVSGRGYWVYLGPTPLTFEVTGPPNTFGQSPSVTYTNSGSIANDGWNLIVNPYPSAIDWDHASWTKTNVDNAIYIYNSSTGSYASYVAGLGVNGGSRYIASQQAFWVKTNASGPAISMVENVKASPDPSFLRSAYSPNTSSYPMAFKDFPIPQNENLLSNSIKLTANGNGFDDETLIYFTEGASADFDGSYDAWKMQNLNPVSPNLSSVINDTMDMSINSYPGLNTDFVIPIRLLVPSSGTYSIRRDSLLMLPLSACIVLEDLANGSLIDLRSNISYSFTISDTTSAPRFLLHIYAPISKKAVSAQCSNDSSGIAIAQGAGAGPWTYIWKNSSGSVVQTTINSSTADTLFNLPVGAYSVQVSGGICGLVTDTIQVRSSSDLSLLLDHADAACYGINNGSAHATLSGGMTPYMFLWSNGATTSAVNNLMIGNYSVIVTDAGGCSLTELFSVSQPPPLKAGFSSSADTVYFLTDNRVSFSDTSIGATSRAWDFGDGSMTDTVQNPIHYYAGSGSYSVRLVVSNGSCFDTAFAYIEVIDSLSTGINDPTSSSFMQAIYENGEVLLAFDLSENSDVTITTYNPLGDKVLVQEERKVRKDRRRLRAEHLSQGVYVISADIEGKTIFTKIFIQ